MFKLNPIATNCNFSSDSFYNSSCESSTSLFYTTCDHTQPLFYKGFKYLFIRRFAKNQSQGISLETPFKRKSIASSTVIPEKFAATIAFIQDLGFCKQNRALNYSVLTQGNHYRSDQISAIDTRQDEDVSIAQDTPEYAHSSRKYALYYLKERRSQKCETLADGSLQAFLLKSAWYALGTRNEAIAHRYSLKKPLQTEAQPLQATGYRGHSFWQWIEPPPDLSIRIPEGTAFLKQGGAL